MFKPFKTLCLFVCTLGLCIGILFLYGLTLCNTHYLYGYINAKGHFLIAPQYNLASEFYNGQARVVQTHPTTGDPYTELTYHYQINKKDEMLTYLGEHPPLHPEDFKWHSYLKSSFKKESLLLPKYDFGSKPLKKGYINVKKNGEWAILPKYDEALEFRNGVAQVMINQRDPLFLWLSDREYWGLINEKGEFVIPRKCLRIGTFNEGLAPCQVRVTFGFYW
jgi:hypothetical protein